VEDSPRVTLGFFPKFFEHWKPHAFFATFALQYIQNLRNFIERKQNNLHKKLAHGSQRFSTLTR
jgi:hypothetical protein